VERPDGLTAGRYCETCSDAVNIIFAGKLRERAARARVGLFPVPEAHIRSNFRSLGTKRATQWGGARWWLCDPT
jgi:hypothetical protein